MNSIHYIWGDLVRKVSGLAWTCRYKTGIFLSAAFIILLLLFDIHTVISNHISAFSEACKIINVHAVRLSSIRFNRALQR